ncbi:MAG: hypothetical protein B7Z72_07280, partial [Gemmatimonadetes bacterium 21-71-4]
MRPDRDGHARASVLQRPDLRQRGQRSATRVAGAGAAGAGQAGRAPAARPRAVTAARLAALTAPVEDYLKAIYELERAGNAAGTNEIAAALRIAPASVSGMVRRLAEQGLIEHEPYRGARLTDAGSNMPRPTNWWTGWRRRSGSRAPIRTARPSRRATGRWTSGGWSRWTISRLARTRACSGWRTTTPGGCAIWPNWASRRARGS